MRILVHTIHDLQFLYLKGSLDAPTKPSKTLWVLYTLCFSINFPKLRMKKPIGRLGISSLTEQYSQRLKQLNEIDQFKARVGWRVSIAASVVSTLAYLIGIFFTSISVTEHLFQVSIRMLLIATVYFQFIQPKIDFWRSSLLFFLSCSSSVMSIIVDL